MSQRCATLHPHVSHPAWPRPDRFSVGSHLLPRVVWLSSGLSHSACAGTVVAATSCGEGDSLKWCRHETGEHTDQKMAVLALYLGWLRHFRRCFGGGLWWFWCGFKVSCFWGVRGGSRLWCRLLCVILQCVQEKNVLVIFCTWESLHPSVTQSTWCTYFWGRGLRVPLPTASRVAALFLALGYFSIGLGDLRGLRLLHLALPLVPFWSSLLIICSRIRRRTRTERSANPRTE